MEFQFVENEQTEPRLNRRVAEIFIYEQALPEVGLKELNSGHFDVVVTLCFFSFTFVGLSSSCR